MIWTDVDIISSAAFEAAFRSMERQRKNQQKPDARVAIYVLKFESGTSWVRKSIITRLVVQVIFCYKGGTNKCRVSEFAWSLNVRNSTLFWNSRMNSYFFFFFVRYPVHLA